ncbi:MAG: helix-turn-helix transcriptional regulator [Henriciella sp.]
MSEKDASGFTASEVDTIVGERIRRRRILSGLTQDQLGEALGVSYQQIQKDETGANRVSAGRLYLLANRLDISPGWFFEGLHDADNQIDEELASSSRFAIDCVRNLAKIKDEKVRAAIQTMVRTLAESDEAEPAKLSPAATMRAEPPN